MSLTSSVFPYLLTGVCRRFTLLKHKRGPDPVGTLQSRKSPRFLVSTGDLATHVHFEDSNLSENDERFEDLEEQDEEEFIEFPIEPRATAAKAKKKAKPRLL